MGNFAAGATAQGVGQAAMGAAQANPQPMRTLENACARFDDIEGILGGFGKRLQEIADHAGGPEVSASQQAGQGAANAPPPPVSLVGRMHIAHDRIIRMLTAMTSEINRIERAMGDTKPNARNG